MPLPPLPAGTFTLAVLPDTQQYAAGNPAGFEAMTRWIAEHRDEQRIVFCSHVGDVVRHFDSPDEWATVEVAMRRLDGIVPYGMSVGNKDMEAPTGDASLFSQTFPPSRYTGAAWYGGQMRDNANSFQLFEAEGLRFCILHLECNAPDPVLAWADQVMDQHADRHFLVTAHMFLGPLDKPVDKNEYFTAPRGVARWSKCHGRAGNSPQQMWDKCLSRQPGLLMILCGDQSRVQSMRMELTGQRVHACLCDYYGAPEGWLRLYRFTPAEHRVEAITYGAVSDTLCAGTPLVPDPGQHQFSLELPM